MIISPSFLRPTLSRHLFASGFGLALLLGAVAAPAGTFRWVDANGVVHYSDRPQPGAEKVTLPPAQTYSAPPAASTPVAAATPAASTAAVPDNSSCAITSPGNEQTLVNVYSIDVTATGPSGGIVRLLLDGTTAQSNAVGAFSAVPVARGTHRLAVVFPGASGAASCRTPTITIYVRQPTLIKKPLPKR